jgi:hypothetical protein
MMWGKRKEDGVWRAKSRDRRLMVLHGDRLVYAALGRMRVRLMRPGA